MVHLCKILSGIAMVVACFALAGAIPTITSVNEVTPFDKRTYLEKRAIVAGQLCANVPVTVPGNFLTGTIVSQSLKYASRETEC